MSFYQNYIQQCNKKGVSPSKAAIDAGTTKTSVNRWKNGSLPTDATIAKLADYFGVTVDELIDEKPSAPNEDFPEVTMIGRASKKMSPADREKMLQLIRIAFPEAFDD